jgi:non-canonical purine NTP pyrophosphatase (RdgB/HAM1 family)
MDLDRLVFVTSNPHKLHEASLILGRSLAHCTVDVAEIQSLDLAEVARHKARAAFATLGRPVLVEDTGLELEGLGGFPGPLVRWLLGAVGAGGICTLAAAFGNRRAIARCVACACDGETVVVAEGVVAGSIVDAPRGSSGFGWDGAFAPDEAGGLTYAEMDDAHKSRLSHRQRALTVLRGELARLATGSGLDG